MTLNSVQLWQQFQVGNADAFGQIAETHYKALYNYGVRFTNDTDLVRDCIQDLLVDLWNSRASLAATDNVKAYLLKALRNKLIKESGRHKRWQTVGEISFSDQDAAELPIESQIVETERQAARIKRLNALLKQLTKREEEIIYLRFYQALDHEAIAQIMGITRPSVATLLHRALKSLRESWFDSILLLCCFLTPTGALPALSGKNV